MSEKVTLKNGFDGYTRSQVGVMTVLLRSLLDDDAVLFYELVMRCRDSNHEFFGTCGVKLQEMQFLDHKQMPHGMVRDIVLSSVTGDGLAMEMGSPVRR